MSTTTNKEKVRINIFGEADMKTLKDGGTVQGHTMTEGEIYMTPRNTQAELVPGTNIDIDANSVITVKDSTAVSGNIPFYDTNKKVVDSGHSVEDMLSPKKVQFEFTETATLVIDPNIVYEITSSAASTETLTITFGAPVSNHVSEYKGNITVGENTPTFTFPSGITWYRGNPAIRGNHSYQFSIESGLGVMIEI